MTLSPPLFFKKRAGPKSAGMGRGLCKLFVFRCAFVLGIYIRLMSEANSAQRYRAELHTFAGRHSESCFDNIDDAHAWIMAGYAELPKAESAAVIFDDADGRRRVFVIDPNLLLPI